MIVWDTRLASSGRDGPSMDSVKMVLSEFGLTNYSLIIGKMRPVHYDTPTEVCAPEERELIARILRYRPLSVHHVTIFFGTTPKLVMDGDWFNEYMAGKSGPFVPSGYTPKIDE